MAERGEQLHINMLALAGGRPYIDARLSRFPGESTIDWSGEQGFRIQNKDHFDDNKRTHMLNVQGRKHRAFLVNHCNRIAQKYNQYVFSTPPKRDGIDDDFALDVTRTGMSVNDYWKLVSSYITATKWCWVGVDRKAPLKDSQGNVMQQSQAEKEARDDRVYWSIYTAEEIVDWNYDSNGELLWALGKFTEYDNHDPMKEPTETKVRVLWERGSVKKYVIDENGVAQLKETFTTSTDKINLFCVGMASDVPHWFDNCESIQRQVMNLHSVYGEALGKDVYPQRVLPMEAVYKMIEERGGIGFDEAADLVLGGAYAILETPEERGIARYITPNGQDLAIARSEINEMKKELYEVVGLVLQKDTKAAESAESKAWSNLDPESVLSERAWALQEAETTLVQMSKAIDSSFHDYEPVYSKDFDISDILSDFQSFQIASTLGMPPLAEKALLMGAVAKLAKITDIDEDTRKLIEAEIAEMDLGVSQIANVGDATE
jgi:hypothetical protein